jgi:hypothetical protein
MQTTIQKLVNAESKDLGEATILLHRFTAEMREANRRRSQEMAESPTSFKKSKTPKK